MKIIIRAFKPQTQLPVTLTPCEDRTGKLYTGQGKGGYYELLTPEEKKELLFVVDAFTQVKLQDGTVLDTTNPIDAINWNWVQKHPYLAMDKTKKNRETAFYVENKQLDAEEKLKRDKPITKAKYIIEYQASESQIKRAAKALGHPSVESFSPEIVRAWLSERAEMDNGRYVHSVLESLNPKNEAEINAKELVSDLIEAGILSRHRGNVYRYGGQNGVFLGRSRDDIYLELLKEENADLVTAMKTDLKKSKEELTT
jgi:hypothetical protein